MRVLYVASQIFMFVGFVGALVGAYLYYRDRDRRVLAAAISCALGVLLPFYGYTIPGVLANFLVPYTIPGSVVSFGLNVVPWFFLLPLTLPRSRRKPQGKQARSRRSGGRR